MTTQYDVNSLDYAYLPEDGYKIDFASFSCPSEYGSSDTYMLIHNYGRHKHGKAGHYQLLFGDGQMTRRLYDEDFNQNRVLWTSSFNIEAGNLDVSIEADAVLDSIDNYQCTNIKEIFEEQVQLVTSKSKGHQHEIAKTLEFGFAQKLPGWNFKSSTTCKDSSSFTQSVESSTYRKVSYEVLIPPCTTGHILGDRVFSSNYDILKDYNDKITGFSHTKTNYCNCPQSVVNDNIAYGVAQPIPKDYDPSTVLKPLEV